ncbi:hypothetical protein SAMN04487907_1146 [Zunongwangia mangrovi]|uniref:Uncharacterized protein n=1 Tax=Zunongwangia mangrovi TaxID=1334022 RepID=A0A1I1N2Z7_9FLAO|nr:DUF5695 domain-containing protein [Zunongwangia mangrovi]SFC92034.1 hypothetical protein SAMN04487907_1146 [Zunongwangia mangrovi]
MKIIRPKRYDKSIILIVLTLMFNLLQAQEKSVKISNADYEVDFSEEGLFSFHSDTDSINLFSKEHVWGKIEVNYRMKGEDWNDLTTHLTRKYYGQDSSVVYVDSLFDMPIYLKRTYRSLKDGVYLDIEIGTTGDQEVELGDVYLPIRWTPPGAGKQNPEPIDIFEGGFLSKESISLNSSFVTYSKPSGEGPFYMMLTQSGTPLEYFDNSEDTFNVYIHSGAKGPITKGSWRLPHTSKALRPKGEKGSKVNYGFKLVTVDHYEDLRDGLYKNGLLDIRASPGYTVPTNLNAQVAFRLKGKIDKVIPEFPENTKIEAIGTSIKGYELYRIKFSRLGENQLKVVYNEGEKTVLEFFVTEPIETLIKKRSSFIVQKQQHKTPGDWWDGLYSVYDMKYETLRGPEDSDGFTGWWGYVLACDDPILGKAAFVAAKNAVFPDSDEIASLEYHIENFVWGGLQRTDKEKPYPYGIYGVPNWHVSRDSTLHAMVFPNDDKAMQIWRAYDYPHIIKMYFHMYEIASFYPDQVSLSANEYLKRATETAKAYFKYPYEIWSWFDTYKWGIYNEMIILDLIETLESKGQADDARFLRGEWEKKAKYFIYDDKYPYRSEHSFDRTAFESSYALAKYAIENKMKPDNNLWYDKNKEKWYSHPSVSTNDARQFMDQQHYAGLAIRGWLSPKYYLAGTDSATRGHAHTSDMTYMAMMGGWSILDYGLYFSQNSDWLELGYNSYLSSWALMNTGTAATDYGYWYPGEKNDGASGWNFISAKNGIPWYQKYEERGVWHYDGEIDLGYGAAFHTARTILVKDAVFGLHVYGGSLKENSKVYKIIPKDGVRQNFSYVLPDKRFHLSLNRDGFLEETPIKINRSNDEISLSLENRAYDVSSNPKEHQTILKIQSDRMKLKEVNASEESLETAKTDIGWEVYIPMDKPEKKLTLIWY